MFRLPGILLRLQMRLRYIKPPKAYRMRRGGFSVQTMYIPAEVLIHFDNTQAGLRNNIYIV